MNIFLFSFRAFLFDISDNIFLYLFMRNFSEINILKILKDNEKYISISAQRAPNEAHHNGNV